MSWMLDDDSEMLELRRKLKDTETHILSLQNEQFKKDQDYQELKRLKDELLLRTQEGIGRIDQVEKELEKKNNQLQEEIIKRQNIETALNSATQNLKQSAKSSRDLQRELDMYSPSSSVPADTHDKVLAERTSLQSRVRELERDIQELQSVAAYSSPQTSRRGHQPPSAQTLDYENRILALEAENKRLTSLAPHTPRRANAHSARRRSSSLSLPAAHVKMSELQEELSAAQSSLEAQEQKSAKLNADLMQAQNAAMASERKVARAVEEADELRDEVTELRQALDEMTRREAKDAEWETKAQGLEEERASACRRAEAAESEVQHVKAELAACRSELARLKEAAPDNQVAQLKERIRQLEVEGESLVDRFLAHGGQGQGQHSEDGKDADRQCSNCSTRLPELQAQLLQCREELDSTTSKLAAAVNDTSRLHNLLDEANQQHERIESIKAAADETIIDLQSQLSHKDALSAQVAVLKERLTVLPTLYDQIERLEARLAARPSAAKSSSGVNWSSIDEEAARGRRDEALQQDLAFAAAREEAAAQRLKLSRECEDLLAQIQNKESGVLHALESTLSENAALWNAVDASRERGAPAEASSPTSSAPALPASSGSLDLDAIPKDYVEHVARLLDAVERLRTERNDLRRSLAFAQKEHGFTVAALEAKLATLNEQLVSTSAEASELHELRQQLEEAREAIQASEAKTAQLSEAVSQLDSADGIIKHLQRLATGTIITLQNTDARACLAEEELISTRHSLSEATLHAFATADELSSARAELETKAQVIQQLQSELNDLTNNRITLQLEVHQLKASMDKAHAHALEAQETIDSLRKDLASSSVPDEAIAVLRAQRDDLQAKVAARTEDLARQMRDMQRLEMNLRVAEDTIEELQEEISGRAGLRDPAEQDTIVDDDVSVVTRLNEELNLSHSETDQPNPLVNAEEEGTAAASATNHLEAANRDLQARFNSLQSSQEELMAITRAADDVATEQLATTVETLFVSIAHERALSRTVQVLNASLSAAQQSIDSKSDELRAMAAHLEIATQERVQTLDELQTLHAQKSETSQALLNATESIQRMSEELSTARSEVDIMSERLIAVQSSSDNRVEVSHQKLAQLSSTIADLEMQLQSSGAMLADVTRSKDELQQSWQTSCAEIAELQTALEAARHEAARVTGLEESVSSLQSAVKQRDQDMELARKSHSEKLSLALADASTQRQTLKETISDLQSRIDSLQHNNDELEVFAEKAREFDGLNQQLKMNLASHAEELNALNGELGSTREQMTTQTRRVEELEKQLDAQAQASREEVQRLQTALDEAKEELARAESHRAQLAADLETAQNSAARHERIAVSADMDKASLQVDLKNAQSSRTRLTQQLEITTNEVQNLKAEVLQLQTSLSDVQFSLSVSEQRVVELSRPSESTVSAADVESLKAQVEEHERLLRRQAGEIEQADDKMIVILKENNKLKAKVETLTKKLVAVQGKYQAMKTEKEHGGDVRRGVEAQSGRQTPVPKTPSALPVVGSSVINRTPGSKTPAAVPSPSSRSFSRTNSISNNIFGASDAVPPVPPLPRSNSGSSNTFGKDSSSHQSSMPRSASGSLNIFGTSNERPVESIPPLPPLPLPAKTLPRTPSAAGSMNVFNSAGAPLAAGVLPAIPPAPITAQLSPIRPLRIPSKGTPGSAVPPSPVAGKKRTVPAEFSMGKEDMSPQAVVRQSPAILRVRSKSGFTPVRSPHHRRLVTDITNLTHTPLARSMKEDANVPMKRPTMLANGRVMSSQSQDLLNQISMAMGNNRL